MREKYKVFSEQYNGILDLVEMVDENLAQLYKKAIEMLPNEVISKLEEKNLFVHDGKNFRVILDKYEDQLYLEHTKYGKYMCTTIILQPFYEDEIDDAVEGELMEIDKDGLFLFSLSFINTEDEPTIRLNYEQKEGENIFKGAQVDGVEIDTEIFIKRKDGEFFLTSTKKFNGLEVYTNRVAVKYSDLISCISSEDLEAYNEMN